MKITAPVGQNGENRSGDVGIVQHLLNLNRQRVPDLREIRADNICGPKTIDAIKLFQNAVLKFRDVDGRVDPDGVTLRALSSGASGKVTGGRTDPALPPMVAPALARPIGFPLRSRNVPDYHPPKGTMMAQHHRYFGAGRKTKAGGYRAHAACDLIAAPGISVLAVDDGSIVYHEPGFFENTDALTIKHSNGLMVRYGEIRATSGLTRAGIDVSLRPGHRPGRRQQKGHLDVAHRILCGFEGGPPIWRQQSLLAARRSHRPNWLP